MSSSADSNAGRTLGDFTILDELGRGGMGVVYRARQRSMNRVVALKVLPSFVGMDTDSVARFRREASAAGRLSHPGIVPVYEVGEQDGIHFYAMELVEGRPIEDLLDALDGRYPERLLGSLFEETGFELSAPLAAGVEGPRFPASCAAIAADVAAALSVAHDNGIIHRDLKPSNILVRQSGQPVLLDFGLARDESAAAAGLTQSGDALGTPSYMSPEQACGIRQLDARVDIYGLGATLYEMLTLRPPFDGPHPAEVMRRIVEEDIVPVRQLNPKVPEDLSRIVHCCLEKFPDDRYPVVDAVESELRSFLAGGPVAVRGASVVARVRRTARRHRRSVALVSAVLVAVTLALGLVGVVGDMRSTEAGEQALREALRHARAAAFGDAAAAYGRAEAALGAEAVARARREHREEVFTALYGARRFAELQEWLAGQEERDDRWQELAARAEGRGRLAVGGTQTMRELRVRAAAPGDEDWRPLTVGQELPLGPHLVEVVAAGRVPVVHTVTIQRDRETVLDAAELPLQVAPPESSFIPSGENAGLFVGRFEVANADLRALLEAAPSRTLKHELEALLRGANDLPLRGLSYIDARNVAALSGAHLLTADEYRRAAGAIDPRWRTPWGGAFDWNRVAAADRGGLTEPVAVRTELGGESPHGVHHLIGNVAEFVAVPVGQRPRVFGGHYQSPERELRVDAFVDVTSLTESVPTAGLRLARFAPAPDQGVDELRGLEASVLDGVAGRVHRYVAGAEGDCRLHVDWLGHHAADRDQLLLVTEPVGFVPRSIEVRDGHGRIAETRGVPSLREDRAEVVVAATGRRGQRFRLAVDVDLQPTTALVMRGAFFEFRASTLVSAGEQGLTVVELPAGSMVDDVSPTPTLVGSQDGRRFVAWRHQPGVERGEQVRVRFRHDGALTSSWPARSDVEAFVGKAFRAMATGTRDELENRLSSDFRLLPSGRTRRDFAGASAGRPELFQLEAIEDVTAVGDVITVWAGVTWIARRGAQETAVPNWPVRIQIQRSPDGLRLRSIAPVGEVDRGQIASGTYVNTIDDVELQLRVPESLGVVRTEGGMTPVQLALEGDDPSVWLSVAACSSVPGENPLVRLSNGACSARAGRCLVEDRRDGVASLFGQVAVRRWDWAFEGGANETHAERWLLVEQGRLKVLFRLTVVVPRSARHLDADALEQILTPRASVLTRLVGALVLK